jgi:hypothetical protein
LECGKSGCVVTRPSQTIDDQVLPFNVVEFLQTAESPLSMGWNWARLEPTNAMRLARLLRTRRQRPRSRRAA